MRPESQQEVPTHYRSSAILLGLVALALLGGLQVDSGSLVLMAAALLLVLFGCSPRCAEVASTILFPLWLISVCVQVSRQQLQAADWRPGTVILTLLLLLLTARECRSAARALKARP
jgi:hypothetical protein